jgi:hypothetical protein
MMSRPRRGGSAAELGIGIEKAVDGLLGDCGALEIHRASREDGDLVQISPALTNITDERDRLLEELPQSDVTVGLRVGHYLLAESVICHFNGQRDEGGISAAARPQRSSQGTDQQVAMCTGLLAQPLVATAQQIVPVRMAKRCVLGPLTSQDIFLVKRHHWLVVQTGELTK